ncbi:unnamed protein product, partial [Heterosigma akashiwo]
MATIHIQQDMKEGGKLMEDEVPRNTAVYRFRGKTYEFARHSCFIFGPESTIRWWVVRIIVNRWFDRFILSVILLNSIFLALTDYSVIDKKGNPVSEGSWSNTLNEKTDLAFTIIFTLECALKVIGMGFYLGHGKQYLKDPWNSLDFIVVVTSLVSVMPAVPDVSAVRCFRVLRPLKSLSSLPGLQALIKTILTAIPQLASVITLLLFCFAIFSILGLSLFQENGIMHTRCRLTPYPVFTNWTAGLNHSDFRCLQEDNVNTVAAGMTKAQSPWAQAQPCYWPIDEDDARICALTNGGGGRLPLPSPLLGLIHTYRWCGANYDAYGNRRFRAATIDGRAYTQYELTRAGTYVEDLNWGFTNFDNILYAFITIFQSVTMEGWSSIMFMTQDAAPAATGLFFVVLIIFGSFLVLNLLLAVLEDNFTASKEEEDNKYIREEDEEEQLSRNSIYLLASRIIPQIKAFHREITGFGNLFEKFAFFCIFQIRLTSASVDTGEDADGASHSGGAGEADGDSMSQQFKFVIHGGTATTVYAEHSALYRLVTAKGFTNFVTLLIVLNTVVLAMDVYVPPDETNALLTYTEAANFALTLMFALEMVLKVVALGLRDYCSDTFNLFDGFIVIISFIELGGSPPSFLGGDASGGGAMSVLRSLRLFRIFKLAREWESMRLLLATLFTTLFDISYFALLLGLFIYVYALIGMQFFANRMKFDDYGDRIEIMADGWNATDTARPNFDTFAWAVTTVFVVLSGENWNTIMYDTWRAVGLWGAVGYYFTLIVTGMFIVMNLFLAILLSNFTSDPPPAEPEEGASIQWNNVEQAVAPEQTPRTGLRRSNTGAELEAAVRKMVSNPDEAKKVSKSVGWGEHVYMKGFAQLELLSWSAAKRRRTKCSDATARVGRQVVVARDVKGAHCMSGKCRGNKNRPPLILRRPSFAFCGLRAQGDCLTLPFRRSRLWEREREREVCACVSRKVQLCTGTQTCTLKNGSHCTYTQISLFFSSSCHEATATCCTCHPHPFSPMTPPQVESGDSTFPLNAGKVCFLFGPTHPVRYTAARIIDHRLFDYTVLGLIMVSSISLALDDPLMDPAGSKKQALSALDNILNVSFTVEMVLKIVALGFAGQPRAYLRNNWNVLDFVVVCISLVSWAFSNVELSAFKALRALRALRPLRMISRAPGLKKVVNTIFQAMPEVFNVMSVLVIIYLIFAIFATNYLKGTFLSCQGDVYDGIFLSSKESEMGSVDAPSFQHLLTFPNKYGPWETWSNETQAWFGPDSPFDLDYSGNCNASWPAAPCCDSWVEDTTTSLANVVDKAPYCCPLLFPLSPGRAGGAGAPYSRSICECWGGSWERDIWQRFDHVGLSLQTFWEISTTEAWVDVMLAAVDSRPPWYQPVRDNNTYWIWFFWIFILFGSYLVMNLFVGVIIDNFQKQSVDSDFVMLTEQQQLFVKTQKIISKLKPMRLNRPPDNAPFSKRCYEIQSHSKFDSAIMVCICANSVVMSMQYYGQGVAYGMALEYINYFFALVFTVEAVIKLFALRKAYFKEGWNCFDFSIVLATNLGLLFYWVFGSSIGSIASIIRTFRIGRVTRLVSRAETLNQLFQTLFSTLVGLSNVAALLFLVLFIHSVTAMQLFSTVALHDDLTEHMNFQTFGKSLLTLIAFSTGENWNGFMWSVATDFDDSCSSSVSYSATMCGYTRSPGCEPLDGCGNPYVVPFMVVFQLLIGFTLINLFVGVILEDFKSHSIGSDAMNKNDLKRFAQHWMKYDPDASYFMPFAKLEQFLKELFPPWGVDPNIDPKDLHQKIARWKLKIYKGNVIHFYDVVHSISQEVLSMKAMDEGYEIADQVRGA